MPRDESIPTVAIRRLPTLRQTLSGLPAKWLAMDGLPIKFAWALVGNLAAGASQIAVLCLIAKLTTAYRVGEYGLAAAIVAPVMALLSLQLRSIQASDTHGHDTFRTYLSLRSASNVLAFIIVFGLAIGSDGAGVLAVVIPVTLTRICLSTSDVMHGAMQRRERMDYIAKSQMLSGSAQVLSLLSVLVATANLTVGCYAMALAALSVLLFFDLPTLRSLQGEESENGECPSSAAASKVRFPIADWIPSIEETRRVAKLAWFALPLGLVIGGIALTSNVPRYYVGHFVDMPSVGILTALMFPGLIMQQVVTALSQATLPRFGQYFAAKDATRFRQLLVKVMATNALLGCVGVGICAIVGREILAILYTDEFTQHNKVFVWVMASFAIVCVGSVGGTLTATRQFRLQLVIAGTTLGAMAVACSLLVPSQGLMGAARALVIVAAVRLVIILACVAIAIRRMRADATSVSADG